MWTRFWYFGTAAGWSPGRGRIRRQSETDLVRGRRRPRLDDTTGAGPPVPDPRHAGQEHLGATGNDATVGSGARQPVRTFAPVPPAHGYRAISSSVRVTPRPGSCGGRMQPSRISSGFVSSASRGKAQVGNSCRRTFGVAKAQCRFAITAAELPQACGATASPCSSAAAAMTFHDPARGAGVGLHDIDAALADQVAELDQSEQVSPPLIGMGEAARTSAMPS